VGEKYEQVKEKEQGESLGDWTLLDGLGELLLYCTVVHFRSDDASCSGPWSNQHAAKQIRLSMAVHAMD
jgi:hypothetical protein